MGATEQIHSIDEVLHEFVHKR